MAESASSKHDRVRSEKRSSPRESFQQKLLRYRRGLQEIQPQLLTENDLRRILKDKTILEGFKKTLTEILIIAKTLIGEQRAEKYFIGVNTFCTFIDDAITQIDVVLDALEKEFESQKFDAHIRTQAYNALKKCRELIESALFQFKEIKQSSRRTV